jgi:alpha-D-ribose 1-methylphosphonate 5-triphosphate synthase subunit PhnH
MAIPPGFADPVLDSQRVFRTVLDVMAHPGRVATLSGLDPPAPLGEAAAAVCLALLDFETPLWLDPSAATGDVVAWLRLHCGVPLVDDGAAARFVLVADAGTMPPLEAFDAGSDERPDLSATLVLQVGGLLGGTGPRLKGPGIDGESRLEVMGAPAGFWPAIGANGARFPRGIDVILCAGDRVAALPRTIRVEV